MIEESRVSCSLMREVGAKNHVLLLYFNFLPVIFMNQRSKYSNVRFSTVTWIQAMQKSQITVDHEAMINIFKSQRTILLMLIVFLRFNS
uniref:Uncharacterized protein n=1 Tax=Arundo donax TaxID=35708 RepID=A0A0A9GTF0_ARUDO